VKKGDPLIEKLIIEIISLRLDGDHFAAARNAPFDAKERTLPRQ
jgi:hypothetical protein